MFLRPVSVSALWHFIGGYELGRISVSAGAEHPFSLPRDFHDWVAYRLHFFESTSGWSNMIIERFGDGRHAFDRFFSLLDEYQVRVPRTVATLSGFDKSHLEIFKDTQRTHVFPSNIMLTAYNDQDPGLFVSAAAGEHFPGEGFCPSLSFFEMFFGPCATKLTILDQAAFDRWSLPLPPTEESQT